MRRIISALLCITVMFCLSGCSDEKIYCLQPFKNDVVFQMGDITVRGTLDYTSKDNITFTLKEPDNVSGAVFTADTVSLDDITVSYSKFADTSPVSLLLRIMTGVSGCEIKMPLKGEYSHNGTGYKIFFDCENEKITTIEAGKFIYTFE